MPTPSNVVLLPAQKRSPTIYVVRFKLPAAVVNTLFTTPVTVVPARPGYTPIPLLMVGRKAAGAYVLGAAVNFDIRWNGAGGQLIRATLAGWLDNAAARVELDIGPGTGAGLYSSLGATNAGNGANLGVLITGGNTSGAGGELDIELEYRYVRTAP